MTANLNGIPCLSKSVDDDTITFLLYNTTIQSISGIDSSNLYLRSEEGIEIEFFGGYYLSSIEILNNGRFNYIVKKKYLGDIDNRIDALYSDFSKLEQSCTSMVSSPAPIVATFMSLSISEISQKYNDSVVAQFRNYFPIWKLNTSYKTGDVFIYDSKYYRVSQDHTSQEQWIPGSIGTESLYYEIVIAPDGIIVWSAPSGAHNTPNKGDLRHYPNADSPIYKSLIDGNAYSPDTYPAGWEIQE